jgi:hypothetical protein
MNNETFVPNPTFERLLKQIQVVLPKLALASILLNYFVTAVINIYSTHLPKYIAIPGAFVVVLGRVIIVTMDYLSFNGRHSIWPSIAASFLTLFALVELYFSLRIQFEDFNHFISAYIFIGTGILLGYILELNFIFKGMEVLYRPKPIVEETQVLKREEVFFHHSEDS